MLVLSLETGKSYHGNSPSSHIHGPLYALKGDFFEDDAASLG